ncbi:MAG: hypothetical protein DPW20_14310 [Candidatus Brocadia sp.]|nr:hypothetical protein [Candidatus Brocadia sp.]
MLRKGKGKRERQAVIYVSKIMSNAKNTEIGRYFGIQGSTVSEALKRVAPPTWFLLPLVSFDDGRR